VIAVILTGVCWLRSVAHVSCPTCGLTRSLALLAHGQLAGSLAMHPWGVAVAAQAAAALPIGGLWFSGRLPERPDRWLPRVVAINALALVALWLARLATGTLPH
jgi:hypothetical protein